MSDTFSPDDVKFMQLALELAAKGQYTTTPNPSVGCVLVKNGEIVGKGFHFKAGQPHAERVALADAGEKAKGATAYVTLEPCSHYGRTPPCALGLIEAGVGRVVGTKMVRHRGGDAAPENGCALGDAATASGGADLFASFFLGHSTPDAVGLLGGQSVGPALLDHRASSANRLGVRSATPTRGAALTLGVEEQLGVQVSARRFVLPFPRVDHGSGQTGDVSHWVPPSCLSCRHFRHTMSARIDTCAVVIQDPF